MGAASLEKYFFFFLHHSDEALLPSLASPCQSSWHRWSLYACSLFSSGPKRCSEHMTRRKQKPVICSEPVQGCPKEPLS